MLQGVSNSGSAAAMTAGFAQNHAGQLIALSSVAAGAALGTLLAAASRTDLVAGALGGALVSEAGTLVGLIGVRLADH